MLTHLENEAHLIAEVCAGNREAFNTLIHHYDRHIYRLALYITDNQADAEDVLQETFLEAYTNLDSFRGNFRFYTWVVRIAVNKAVLKSRKWQDDRATSLEDPFTTEDKSSFPQEVEHWSDNLEQRYPQNELQAILHQAIETLEPQFRTVVALRDMENFSTEETAELLGLSVPTVKLYLLGGRLQLRARLNKHFKRGKTERK